MYRTTPTHLIEYLVDHGREGELLGEWSLFKCHVIVGEHVQDPLKLLAGLHKHWSVVVCLQQVPEYSNSILHSSVCFKLKDFCVTLNMYTYRYTPMTNPLHYYSTFLYYTTYDYTYWATTSSTVCMEWCLLEGITVCLHKKFFIVLSGEQNLHAHEHAEWQIRYCTCTCMYSVNQRWWYVHQSVCTKLLNPLSPIDDTMQCSSRTCIWYIHVPDLQQHLIQLLHPESIALGGSKYTIVIRVFTGYWGWWYTHRGVPGLLTLMVWQNQTMSCFTFSKRWLLVQDNWKQK